MRTIDQTDKSESPSCAHCGSKSPEFGFETRVIITRDRNPANGKVEIVRKRFTVCKGEPCGGYLQMAHEG